MTTGKPATFDPPPRRLRGPGADAHNNAPNVNHHPKSNEAEWLGNDAQSTAFTVAEAARLDTMGGKK